MRPGEASGLPYELRPNLSGELMLRPFATNSWGLRSRELEKRKAPGVYRIVGLGDSHMFGWGVGQDEMYLSLLERRLERTALPGRRFEVVNCAVPGYNTILEVARFEVLCAGFEPDLVLLHIVGNDLDLPLFLRTDRPRPRSFLLSAVRSLFTPRAKREAGDQDDLSVLRDKKQRQRPAEEARASTARAIDRLARRAREGGFPVVVFTLSREGPARAILLGLAESHGWPVVDAWPATWAELRRRGLPEDEPTWRREFVYINEDHPSAKANRLYADLLWRELTRLEIVPARGSAS